MRGASLKQKFYILISVVFIAFVIISAFTIYSLRKISILNNLRSQSMALQIMNLEQRKNEKDFLTREMINREYFKTLKSDYLDEFRANSDSIQKILNDMINNKSYMNDELLGLISDLSSDIKVYESSFMSIVEAKNQKGFFNYGLEGEFRKSAYHAERIIKESKQNNILISLLTMRRREKDFLIEKDLKNAKSFNAEADNISELLKSKGNSDSISIYVKAYITKFNNLVEKEKEIGLTEKEGILGKMRDAIHNVEPRLNQLEVQISEYIDKANTRTIIYLSLVLIAGILVVSVFCIYITRDVYRTLGGEPSLVADISDKIARGDLDKIENTNLKRGAIGSMFQMVDKLKEVVSVIHDRSNQMSSSANQLRATAEQLSGAANEQASSLEEVSSSMEQMVANILQNTDHAKESEKIASQTFNGISETGKALENSLNKVRSITEKIDIINDIAFQTNILALNAAVEAARAGEQGRGFAVVAAEVRKLAEKSKVAANEIVDLSAVSLESTEVSSNKMNEIMPQINRTAQLLQEIAVSSTEQSSGADQVNNAIQQMNGITQENAAAAEELASNTEELAQQAVALKEMIGFFKV